MTRLPRDAVAQLRRLLETWWRNGWSETTPTALSHWMQETAAWGPTSPRPEVALALAEDLNIVVPAARGTVTVHGNVRIAAADEVSLWRHVAFAVFERMLAHDRFSLDLAQVLASLSLQSGLPLVAWDAVAPEARGNPAWIWLQQLQLGEHLDDRFVADERLTPHVADVPQASVRVRLSAAELDERIRRQNERAARAEELVVELERLRLRAAGTAELAEAVTRVSLDDVAAGFDVRSFEVDGSPRCIEVKSCAGPRELFFVSSNEQRAASVLGGKYWLAWVGWAARLPHGPSEVVWFRDLHSLLLRPPHAWACDSSGLVVRRTADDLSAATLVTNL